MIAGLWASISAAKASLILYGIAAAAGALIVIGIFQAGANSERRKCDAAALRAQLAAEKQDHDATKKALAHDRAAREALEKQRETDDEATRTLLSDLAKRAPADRCELSDSDARRLR